MKKKHFAQIENVFPEIRGNTEKQIKFNIEVMSKVDKLYFFSPYFKLSKEILDAVIKKYEYNPKVKLISRVHAIINLKKDNVFIVKNTEDGNDKFLASFVKQEINWGGISKKLEYNESEKYYITKDFKIIKEFEDESLDIFKENNQEEISNISSLRIKRLLEELTILNSNVNLHLDTHPYRKMNEGFKEIYIEILLYMSCINQELAASQVARLEEIARQFNISSLWLKEKLVKECLKSGEEKRKEKIKSLISSIEIPDKRILLADMLSLDILRRKYCDGKDKLIKKLDLLLNVKYSDVVQIKLYLEKIL